MTITLNEIGRRYYGYSYDKSAINNHAERTYIVLEDGHIFGGLLVDCCTDVSPREFRMAHVAVNPDTMEIIPIRIFEIGLPRHVTTWKNALNYIKIHFEEFVEQ